MQTYAEGVYDFLCDVVKTTWIIFREIYFRIIIFNILKFIYKLLFINNLTDT